MERKSMIKVRGGFSDRAGIDPCNIQMQIDDFDERTRTFISNKLYDFLQVTFNHECETRNIKYGPTDQNLSNIFCKNLMQNVFADLNHLPLGYHYDWEKFYSRIEEVLMEAPYNEVLDLLWYICNWFALSTNNCIDVFQEWFNELFQSEYVGYRFISGEIVRFLYKGIIIKHNKTEPTYTKTSLFLCEKRRFLWPGLRKEGNLFKLAGPGGLAFFHLTKKEVSKWPMKK